MDVVRREFLKLLGYIGSLGVVAGIGALGYQSTTDDDDEADNSNESRNTTQSENQTTDYQSDDQNATQEPDNETTMNESNQTADDEEKPLTPDENESRHSGDYNETGQMKETVERSRDEVKISNRSAVMNNSGGVTYTADITNVSNEPIDEIEVYVDYHVMGEYAYGDTTRLSNLAPGATEEITSTAPRSRVGRANPNTIEVEISEVQAYDYASSGS